MQELTVTSKFNNQLETRERILTNSRLAPNTVAAYRTSLKQFDGWLGGRDVTPTHVKMWLAELSKDYSTNTLNVRRAAVIFIANEVATLAMETFAPDIHAGHVRSEILNRVALIKAIPSYAVQGVKVGEWLDKDQTAVLLKEMPEKYQFITRLIIGTGLRISEALSLNSYDFLERDGRLVLNVEGKGKRGEKKFRVVPVPPWIDVTGFDGFSFHRTSFASALNRMCKKLFDKSVTPHDLRRTAARLWYNATRANGQKDGGIYEVCQLLGHANIEITQEYIGATVDLANPVNDLVSF